MQNGTDNRKLGYWGKNLPLFLTPPQNLVPSDQVSKLYPFRERRVTNYLSRERTVKNKMHPNSSIHLVVCLTTGPKPLPKQALHIVRSRASSFKWQYPLLSLKSFSSFLRLHPRLPVTSIPPCIFPSITRPRRQFLRKMWPIQFAFRLLISCRIFLCSLTLSNTSSFLTWSVQLIFSILLQHHVSKLSRCFWSTARSVQVSAPYKAMLQM